ncbi:MAG: hypothetical protein HY718_17370 [Planctomycetes bacterium]|nr:hypothetical protein [Planctomycetota bacterium]
MNPPLPGRPCLFAVLALACVASMSALAQTTQPAANLPDGFRAHVVAVDGGWVDWTRGLVIAEGLGRAKGTGAQQRLMAQRAAEVVAVRNALAAVNDVRIDADGRVAGIRAGSVRVQGVVRGQRVTRSQWSPDAKPPEARATIEVPVWGIAGVATTFWRTRQVQSLYGKTHRIELTAAPAPTSDALVVLDARGHVVSECLFPAVVDSQGRMLYDIATLPPPVARDVAVARYLESNLTFEHLRDADSTDSSTGTTTQPDSSAYTRNVPGRQRIVVKVIDVTGPHHTDLVLAPADADRLAASPEAVAALRQAQVVIVVDRAQSR